MVFSVYFDNKTKFLVIYQHVTKCARSISKYTGLARSTIYDWIDKIDIDEDIFETKPGRALKPKLNQDQQKKLTDSAQKKPSQASTRKLGGAAFEILRETTREILHENGLQFRKKDGEKYHVHTEDRVSFCQEMLKRNGEEIYETFFSDEMGINLKDCKKDKAWTVPGKSVHIKNSTENVRLNCWATISSEGATSLHIFERNLNG